LKAWASVSPVPSVRLPASVVAAPSAAVVVVPSAVVVVVPSAAVAAVPSAAAVAVTVAVVGYQLVAPGWR